MTVAMTPSSGSDPIHRHNAYWFLANGCSRFLVIGVLLSPPLDIVAGNSGIGLEGQRRRWNCGDYVKRLSRCKTTLMT